MRTIKIILLVGTVAVVTACHTSKKSSSSTASTAPASPTAPIVVRSPDGIYPPGNAELTAIQTRYADVTLEKLNEGHQLYTKGACILCHTAQNIYVYGETQWKDIIDDMARKAAISVEQKDAVYKYVLAIKAAQPNGGK